MTVVEREAAADTIEPMRVDIRLYDRTPQPIMVVVAEAASSARMTAELYDNPAHDEGEPARLSVEVERPGCKIWFPGLLAGFYSYRVVLGGRHLFGGSLTASPSSEPVPPGAVRSATFDTEHGLVEVAL